MKKNSFIKIIKNKFFIAASCIIIIVIIGITVLLNNNRDTKENKCLIQFDTNGGESIDSISVDCGKSIEENVITKKEGFSFKYWTYGDKQIDLTNFVINDSVIVKANWEANDNNIITIHFDTDGGNSIDDVEIVKGTKISRPINPEKEGYRFVEWVLNNKKYDFNANVEQSMTLKATWAKNDNNKSNGKSNSVSSNENNNKLNENSQATNNKQEQSNSIKCTGYFVKDVPEKTVTTGYNDHINWTFSTGGSYSSDDCYITYKSSNTSVASVDSSGRIKALNKGETYIYECINDNKTNKEVTCFRGKLIVNSNNVDNCKERSMSFANAVSGYYWYLDGYNYAYMYTKIKDWYDHTILDVDSGYLGLKNNKFVTAEEMNSNNDLGQSELHNEFFFNPTELGCSTIDKHNMYVSGNKLYITVGGKKYSFTKYSSRKSEKVSLSTSNSSLTINENNSQDVSFRIGNSFLPNNIEVSSSKPLVALCSIKSIVNSNGTIECNGFNSGQSVITIKDKIGGNSVQINLTVNHISIPVTGVSLNNTTLSLQRGKTYKLVATVSPSSADNKNVTWNSSNSSIVTVDSNGNVKAISKGNATITVTTSDGNYSASCNIEVSNPPLTAKASIGLSTRFSSSEISEGVNVSLENISGGTGTYTYYYIKLYKEGTLIGETSSRELFVKGYKNGTYTAQFTIRDNEGNEYNGNAGPVTISVE